jgi:uncharacterized protein YjeT (DUF2065 family)
VIRLYAAIGIVAIIVGLGGYALLERSWRQLATQRAAALEADLSAMGAALAAEKANAARSAAIAAAQSQRAQEARLQTEATEDRARAIIEDLMREQVDRPDCSCDFDDAWRQRLRTEIPIRRPAPKPADPGVGQLRVDTLQ